MTGQELYDMYVQAHADEGIGIDEWADLPPTDHDIWNAIAAGLLRK